ncbi:ferric reductase-like transmembrane domain-containing protein [Cohnella ginsengisoli]|uniref:Ferric reductase-like transmembrane domain-containing protein n=1 Tax=Cohnella ginsengisoli TaxID=425004 RepID=A0A9X4KIC3_9BACL|nr:ferric reductase-like transmembrane domain-containing protein [Cohnella ginsengisoli]MDG0792069.1 ferric reductase-like transmembrane domain-containing protein [Cohnella ginsengisoli]
MNGLADWLTVWTTTRAAGITCYLLLFVSTGAGILTSLKLFGPKTRAGVLFLHQSAGWFGFLFGALHGSVLMFDKYVGYSPMELLVPFAARTHPYLMGIGTLSFYITLILIASSDMMKRLGKKTWRAIHFLAFPGFFMGLVHGLLLGTDSSQPWMKWTYIATAGLVVALTIFRIAVPSPTGVAKTRAKAAA